MSTTPRVDAAQLLTWLDRHGQDGPAVRCAIYTGLAERIRRGDFTLTAGARPIFTCSVCGTEDAEETIDGETFCTVCDAVAVAPAAEATGVQPEGS